MKAAIEIHMFSAVARATQAVAGRTPGQHHPLLIFVRQAADTEHDLAAAAAVAESQGWDGVDITRAGTLPPDAEAQMQEPLLGVYRAALQDGRGLIAFEAVVRPAPRKA